MVWVSIVVALVMAVVGEILRPKTKFSNPEPSAVGDFSFPTVDPSRVVPIFWGTCKMQGPNCTWFGDLEVVTLKKKVKTGWFSSTKVTIGFNYYLGVQLVYAYGECDEFLELRADDKPLTLRSGPPTYTTVLGQQVPTPAGLSDKQFVGDVCSFYIDSPSILSADDPPSGVKGVAKLYKGTFAQPANEYLGVQWGEPDMSAFRPLVHLVLEKCYLGNTETPPPFTLIARRCPNQLGLTGGMHNVNGDANIACAAYELMTDMLWGMKVPVTKINADSFRECGVTTFNEGLGISMLIQNATSGRELLAEVLRHADAVVYADPITGLYTMSLARDDYLDHLEELIVLDDSNIVPDTFEFSRMSWELTKNTIIVNYTDRETFQTTPVQYQELANIDVRQGTVDPEEINFLGFSNPNAALNAAARASKTKSSPLLSASFNVNRIGYQLRPGSVFILNRPQNKLSQVIMRVIEISYGTLDDMAIKIKAMEDVFAVGHIAYALPTPSDWVDLVGPPQALTRQAVFEIPYQFTGSDGVYLGTLASKQTPTEAAYEVWSGAASGDANLVFRSSASDYTASGLLVAQYPSNTDARDTVGFQVNSTFHMDEVTGVVESDLLLGDSIALIISPAGREFVAFKNKTVVGGGVYGISDVIRGVYGTTPLTHAAGSTVWFLSSGFAVENEVPRAAGAAVYLKYLPRNKSGVLPLASATQLSITPTGVAAKPNPPSYLRADGIASPASLPEGDVTFTWEWRDVQVQGGRITTGGTGYDPVPNGGFFTASIYVSGVLKRTVNNLTVFSLLYSEADQIADGSRGVSSELRVKYTSPSGVASETAVLSFTADSSSASVLNFGGVDGSQVIVDEYSKTWTAMGNAQIDTSMGYNRLLLDGSGAYVETPHHADFDFGSLPFSLEFFKVSLSGYPNNNNGVYQSALACKDVDHATNPTRAWACGFYGTASSITGIYFIVFTNKTTYVLLQAPAAISLNTLYDISCERDGNTLRIYLDGVQIGSTSYTGTIQNTPGVPVRIGANVWGGGYDYFLNGSLRASRITNGLCLHPGGVTYTPETPPVM